MQGQTINPSKPVPVDTAIKIGKLENGFTYYIRHNTKPENRFELRLAVNAGSILEDDDQLGLAHFVEHMAFNGTKNFEKNELIKYLESMGIKFGPEINAYTSFDETVYMLSVPSDSAVLVEKSFLIMEDWAHQLSFDNHEIDKERGVIIEEWRIGQGPNQRMQNKYFPVIFKDSRYAERLPIGKKEILESFSYDTIKRFYRDWYRPDLMALVVIGDIDPVVAEEKIKQHFSNLTMPANPRERLEYEVPNHSGTLVSVVTDKEAPYTLLRLFYKTDTLPSQTGTDYMNSLKYSFITGVLNRRIAELTEKADPPFIAAGFYFGGLASRSKNALQAYAAVGENGIETGLSSILTEVNRMATHGITSGEFERYKLDLLKRFEQAYAEKDKHESADLADEYMRNFLENEPIPGIEWEYTLVKENLDKIDLAELNKLAASILGNDNNIIVVTAPEKENVQIPSEAGILAISEKVYSSKIEPYSDNVASVSLLKKLPKAGKITTEKEIKSIGAVELKLSNGITVLLKPTDFKNDEIIMSAYSWGGTSVYEQKDHFSALHADRIISESGLADFSNSDLTKILAGKNAYTAATIGTETEEIVGNCRVADLETMFQLTYLRFTSPRVDTASFQSYITKNRNLYRNLGQEPSNYFYDKYNRIRAQNHPRGNYLPLESDWDKVDYKRVVEIYKDRFSNAGEFTFVLVGAFNIETIKPFITQYLASLPATKRKESYRDLGIRPPTGMVNEKVFKGTEPKSLAIVSFNKEAGYSFEDAFLMSQLGQILNRKYYELLREEMSGVYGVRTNSSLFRIPYQRASLTITIPCSPENVDSLVQTAINEIKKIQSVGISEEDVLKAREIYKREKEKNLKENSFWLNSLMDCYRTERDFETIPSFNLVDSITSENIMRVANKYIDLSNCLQVVLYPENMQE